MTLTGAGGVVGDGEHTNIPSIPPCLRLPCQQPGQVPKLSLKKGTTTLGFRFAQRLSAPQNMIPFLLTLLALILGMRHFEEGDTPLCVAPRGIFFWHCPGNERSSKFPLSSSSILEITNPNLHPNFNHYQTDRKQKKLSEKHFGLNDF